MDVSISGKINPKNGFIINLKTIDSIVNEFVELLDHSQIEKDIPWFKGKQPSTENLTVYLWDHINSKIPEPAKLYKIRIYETPRIFTDYYGSGNELND